MLREEGESARTQKAKLSKDRQEEESIAQKLMQARSFYIDASYNNGNKTSASAMVEVSGEMENISTKKYQEVGNATQAEALGAWEVVKQAKVNTQLTIYTDNEALANMLEEMKPEETGKSRKNKKRWSAFWEIAEDIREEIVKKNLTVKAVKVKAHSGNRHNDKADVAAKEAAREAIEGEPVKAGIHRYTITWERQQINTSCKVLSDNMQLAEESAAFLTSRRIEGWLPYQRRQRVEWECTRACIQEHKDKQQKSLSFERSKRKIFNIKKVVDELPTLEVLKKRNSTLYAKQENCPNCNKGKENISHIWRCQGNETTLKEYKKELERGIEAKIVARQAKDPEGIREYWEKITKQKEKQKLEKQNRSVGKR